MPSYLTQQKKRCIFLFVCFNMKMLSSKVTPPKAVWK